MSTPERTDLIVGESIEAYLARELPEGEVGESALVQDLGRKVAPDAETFVSASLTGYRLDETPE